MKVVKLLFFKVFQFKIYLEASSSIHLNKPQT